LHHDHIDGYLETEQRLYWIIADFLCILLTSLRFFPHFLSSLNHLLLASPCTSFCASFFRLWVNMSSPPETMENPSKPYEDDDELDEPQESVEQDDGNNAGEGSSSPAKRGRGRPKGSKNKKGGTSTNATAGSSTPSKKRGRPPKPKNPDDSESEPQPKRKRGRPPKPKPEPTEGAEEEPAVKRKRGRPPKKPSA